MTSLGDVIERVLNETDWNVGNEELAREISERIPDELLRHALRDALVSVIPIVKNRVNRQLITGSGSGPIRQRQPAQPDIQGESGRTYVSTRIAFLNEKRDRFLSIGFQGVQGSVQFRTATVFEILEEAQRLERKGMTTLARSELFREVALTIREAGVRSAAELPVEVQEKFADRFRELYIHAEGDE